MVNLETNSNLENSDVVGWEDVANLADKMHPEEQSLQVESSESRDEHFEAMRDSFLNMLNSKHEKLNQTKEQLMYAQKENDGRRINLYTKRIHSLLGTIANLEGRLSIMRPNNEIDLRERADVLANFGRAINEVIPDGTPLVFHGNNNLSTVKEIINSGGLKTPEERGVDYKSFATLIDVTAKSNLRVSLEFADAGINSFMPYGAIFAFYPQEDECEVVLKTGESSQVSSGVKGVGFDEDRFFGIITTIENVEDLKQVFEANNFDPKKVFTHKQFLEHCEEVFHTQVHQDIGG